MRAGAGGADQSSCLHSLQLAAGPPAASSSMRKMMRKMTRKMMRKMMRKMVRKMVRKMARKMVRKTIRKMLLPNTKLAFASYTDQLSTEIIHYTLHRIHLWPFCH